MIQLVSLHINTGQPQALGQFYAKLFGLEPAWSAHGVTGFMVGDFRLEIAQHDQVTGKNTSPERIFFDLMVDNVQAEFDRLVMLGATVIQEPYEFADEEMKMVIATMADLDGNYFQLVSMQ